LSDDGFSSCSSVELRAIHRRGAEEAQRNSKFKIQNSKFKIQNSKFKIQNSKFKIQNSKSQISKLTISRRKPQRPLCVLCASAVSLTCFKLRNE
jgi:hypothetical protein